MTQQQTRYQSWAKVGLCVLMVGVSMALVQYKVPTIMPALMEQFSMDATCASWLMSILCLVMVPLAVPCGMLCTKIGPKRCIAVACGVMAAGTLVGAFTSSVVLLMIDRALEGAAICMLTVCGPVLIGATVDPARNGSAMGLWGIWGPLGSAAAGLATPTVYAAFGTSGLWLSYGAVVVAFTALMLVAVKEPPAQADAPDVAQAAAAGGAPSIRQVFTRNTVLFFCGFAAFNVVLLAVLSFVPTILQAKGMDATMSGLVSTLPMILSVVSSPVFGMLSDKTGQTKWLLVLTMAFLGPCALALYCLDGAGMWAAAAVMGLVGMGSSGLMIAAFMQVLPDPRLAEVGMGVLITVQGIGQFLGSFLVQMLLGPAMDRVLFAGTVVMVLALAGTACVAAARFRK